VRASVSDVGVTGLAWRRGLVVVGWLEMVSSVGRIRASPLVCASALGLGDEVVFCWPKRFRKLIGGLRRALGLPCGSRGEAQTVPISVSSACLLTEIGMTRCS